MKKATIAMVAVVFAAFAAQANTTSANIVGYSKSGILVVSLSLLCSLMVGQQVLQLFMVIELPSGSKIYTFDGSGYTIASYGTALFLVKDW